LHITLQPFEYHFGQLLDKVAFFLSSPITSLGQYAGTAMTPLNTMAPEVGVGWEKKNWTDTKQGEEIEFSPERTKAK
jgi:hypothetical protein